MLQDPRSGERWLVPVASGVIVLVLAAIATWQLHTRLDELAGQRLDHQLDATVLEVGERLADAGDLAASIAALEAGSEEVTPEELAAFVSSTSRQRSLSEAFPGVTGVLMLDATATGGLELRQGLHTIADVEPAMEALAACPTCAESLARSSDGDGEVEALLLDEELAAAVGGQVLLVEALAAEGAAAPPRWVVVSIDLTELTAGIDGPEITEVLPATDGTAPDVAAPADPMARRDPTQQRQITSSGTDLEVTMATPPGLLTATERFAPLALVVTGLLVSALIVALLRSAGTTRRRALVAVAEATADQRNANDRLAAANRRLAAANEELERFAGVVAHDLRAPLTHIEGLVEVVRSGRTSEADAVAMLDRALGNTARLERLIDDLLQYAAAGQTIGERRPVDLTAVAEEAVERLTATIADRGATVVIDELPNAQGDAVRLLQVFQNVIGNAVRHATSGTGPHVEVSGSRDDGRVTVTIADDGPGIPPGDRGRVLAAFERGDRASRDGSGLGLATVVRIVMAHDGRITLDDAPTGGLAVHIELPAG